MLRPPSGDTPGTVLLAAAAKQQTDFGAWRRFSSDPVHDKPGVSRGVPIIDLLDDEVIDARFLHAGV